MTFVGEGPPHYSPNSVPLGSCDISNSFPRDTAITRGIISDWRTHFLSIRRGALSSGKQPQNNDGRS